MVIEVHLPHHANSTAGKRLALLKSADEVRAHCLAGGPMRYLTLTLRGKVFRYKIRKDKNPASGWQVLARIPIERKVPRKEGQKLRGHALVGHIGADFKFKRRGKSLSNDDPLIQAFLELYDVVFIRNVMRPAEMRIEAEIIEPPTVDTARTKPAGGETIVG
jgi:hypothetical protein